MKHFRVGMEKHFPFFRPAKGLRKDRGSDINLLNTLATSLNFTYSIVRPSDGNWGSLNGSEWSGMIGMLINGEADIALSGMTITYDRYSAVKFSTPYAFDRITFVTRKPERKSKTWAIFWPYTMDVWFSGVLAIFIVSLLMTFLRNALKPSKHRRVRLEDTALYIFQAVLTQGHYNARELRCRVLMSFWWGFCITMVAGYNGSLMSFMAHPGFNPALDTVQKLVEAIRSGQFAVGTIKNSADFAIFRDSNEPDIRTILESMESDPRNLVLHDVDGLRECLHREYAYVGGERTVWADIWDPRLFLFAKDSFLHYGYAVAFSSAFDLTVNFNRKIRQLQQAGLIEKWAEDIIGRHRSSHRGDEEYEDLKGANRHVLRIDDVQGAFSVLTIGLSVACLSYIAEYQVYLYKSRKERKNHKKR